jgi:excisionase family DNA binding protein
MRRNGRNQMRRQAGHKKTSRGNGRVTMPEGSAPSGQSLLDRRIPLADLPEFLSPDEFRAYIGLSRNTVYDLLRRGEIAHLKFGHSIRIPKAALKDRLSAVGCGP